MPPRNDDTANTGRERTSGRASGRLGTAAERDATGRESALLARTPRIPAGWRIIAGKEFGDNLLSIRFFVLVIVLALVGIAAVYSAASGIKDAASQAAQAPSPFLLLFTSTSKGSDIPSFVTLIGFLGPLVGIAYAFDAINNERSQRTLPRLVSQPVHRDDIINGKFVAGLGVVTVTIVAVTAVVAAIGIMRLGITPSPDDVARLILYLVFTIVYIGLWMAFSLLCSVTMRRAATSALVAIGVWLVLAIFGALLAGLLADVLSPVDAAQSAASTIAHAKMENNLALISPIDLYHQATGALLNPSVRTTAAFVTQSQAQGAVPSSLSLTQSIAVVWPQIIALIAASVVVSAIAYLVFLKQEVRA